MRSFRLASRVLLLALSISTSANADGTLPELASRGVYRADVLAPIDGQAELEIEILRPPEGRPWPAPVREYLRQKVLEEWPRDRRYGPIHSRVALWLEYPLLNAGGGNRIILPVLDGAELPIRGRVVAPPSRFAGRAVILLDVSESANSRTALLTEEGSAEWISAVQAGFATLRGLLERLEAESEEFGDALGPSEIGIIAFGESTWPIVEPVGSLQTARSRLDAYEPDGFEGAGRTDAVCALRLAEDWLSGPSGLTGEIIILTDGDLPFSGRFTDCDAPNFRRPSDRAACLASLNRSPCPASHEFQKSQGRSDVAQLFSFVRDTRGKIPVFPMLFRLDRAPRFYRELASHTGGWTVAVGSARQVEGAISSLFTHDQDAVEIQGVFARNLRTEEVTGNLLGPDGGDFTGVLPLAPGSNDVELEIQGSGGHAGLFRFRVYSAAGFLQTYLEHIGNTNRQLERRLEDLSEQTRDRMRPVFTREVEITPEPEPPVTEQSSDPRLPGG